MQKFIVPYTWVHSSDDPSDGELITVEVDHEDELETTTINQLKSQFLKEEKDAVQTLGEIYMDEDEEDAVGFELSILDVFDSYDFGFAINLQGAIEISKPPEIYTEHIIQSYRIFLALQVEADDDEFESLTHLYYFNKAYERYESILLKYMEDNKIEVGSFNKFHPLAEHLDKLYPEDEE